MITLEGKNLCERQKDLNLKVKEAVKNKVDLQDVKCEENSDVDRIFKIELASEYKNVDYILEELKSGDSLYISRVLKCKWLYGSAYAHLINPEFLDRNIFPKMSLTMKKKMLNTISVNIKDETRAELFYNYYKNTSFSCYGDKFLIFTSELFKLNLLRNIESFANLPGGTRFYRNLIGNSFMLADVCGEKGLELKEVSHLYNVNEENYLDLLEKHDDVPITIDILPSKGYLGEKVSRSIMKKHKNRILQNPLPYLNNLNREVLYKYSSSDDVKIYLVARLPETENLFWETDYCNSNEEIINMLNPGTKFQFIKQIFEDKYKTSDFEMNSRFYQSNYSRIMTFKEREAWALKLIGMSSSMLSESDNYKLCKFIPFAKSLPLLNCEICKTADADKRSDVLKVLLQTARTKEDLEKILNYYYNRHMYEPPEKKMIFLEAVIEYHNVFEFNEGCWVAFDMILQNFLLHNLACPDMDFLFVALMYRIIKDKTLPEYLQVLVRRGINYESNFVKYVNRLTNEEKDLVYKYLNSTIMESIIFETQNYNADFWEKVRHCIGALLHFRRIFNINGEFPEIVLKIVKLDSKFWKFIFKDKVKSKPKLTEVCLLRHLKRDASLIVEMLPSIIDEYNNTTCFKINSLLRKIKTFFGNDIAKQCVEYFTKSLYDRLRLNSTNYRDVYGIVFALFQLGDERSKTELMDKFAPKNWKIEQDKMDCKDYITQVAICRFQSYARPPVPLCKTALYIKGDYLRHCEGMLYMYLSNLSPALVEDFIKLLLNSPWPSLRRGIDLVFQNREIGNLDYLVANVWKETKNTEIRKRIYMLTLKRIINRKLGKLVRQVFKLLLKLTETIKEDDDDEIFACFNGNKIHEDLRGDYLVVCWNRLDEWPLTNVLIERRKLVANSILSNMNLVRAECLYWLICELINKRFQKKISHDIWKNELSQILRDLIFRYILDINDELKQICSLSIVRFYAEECFKRWNDEHSTGILIYQELFNDFVLSIIKEPCYFSPQFLAIIPIAERMLDDFENKIGITQTYSRFWDWKLALITRKAICGRNRCDHNVYIYFGWYLGEFVRQLKAKNCYYISFLEKILGKISSFINEMNENRTPWLSAIDASVLTVFGLLFNDIFENYVLALKILPDDLTVSPAYRIYLLQVLRLIKNQSNEELNAFIKDKFDYRDIKMRKILESE